MTPDSSLSQCAGIQGSELAIIVPTFNERKNLETLVQRLDQLLAGTRWEVVFVDDDSPDGTAEAARELARRDNRVRCIHRIGRRGLASACIEGFLSTSASVLAVMDGDLQHDERLLPKMLQCLKDEQLDLVLGSRYVEGGGIGAWDGARSRASRYATRLAAFVCKQPVADPMSGFFMVRREAFDAAMPNLSGVGFKILLDLFASSPTPLRFKEIPYEFRNRSEGESKFDGRAIWEYLYLLLEKSAGRYVPARFIVFSAVGGIGVLVHMAVLWTAFRGFGSSFIMGQSIATLVAITFNYWLNNISTYRDRRRTGWRWFTGWAGFLLACSLGAVANVGVAAFLFDRHSTMWMVSGLAGIMVGAVWNYAVTSAYTWNTKRNQ